MLVVTPPRAQGVIGAAALDQRGTLIGVVTSVNRDQAYITSIEIAQRVEQDLSDYGEVQRGSLGVTVSDSPAGGALVEAVAVDGPASGSVEAGDRITWVGGRQISSIADLAYVLTEFEPTDEVSVTVDRDGQPQTSYVNLSVDTSLAEPGQ